MKLADQLTDYVHAAFTGLWVQTQEPDEAEREILQLARHQQWKTAVWDVADGLCVCSPATKAHADVGPGDPLAARRPRAVIPVPDRARADRSRSRSVTGRRVPTRRTASSSTRGWPTSRRPTRTSS